MRPLDDVLVLDLTRVLAGPFCTMHLADMGAEVIKVERPGSGDDTRRFGPPFVEGVSTYFLAVNRGKKSVVLDLKAAEDVAVLRRIARRADVVVENFRPGTMERLGLGYETLKADNAGLIYASVSGYGAVDGLADYTARPGYDLVAQGVGGIQGVTGQPDGPPTKCGTSIADLAAGLYCFQGILLALLARHRSGLGQRVDISMQDCQAALLTYHATGQMMAGAPARRLGNAHPSIAPYEAYPTRDGHLNIAAANDTMFGRLCAALGVPELSGDGRFATNADRVEHREALFSAIAAITTQHDRDPLAALLTAHGVVAGPILTVEQVVAHPQIEARGMIVRQAHPVVGPIASIGNPIRLLSTPAAYELPPPTLGQHTEEILARFPEPERV